jgi:hypothetical protein
MPGVGVEESIGRHAELLEPSFVLFLASLFLAPQAGISPMHLLGKDKCLGVGRGIHSIYWLVNAGERGDLLSAGQRVGLVSAGQPVTFLMALPDVLNDFEVAREKYVNDPITATTSKLTISPYSTAVAPRSSIRARCVS